MQNKQKILSAAMLIACSSISTQSHAILADGLRLDFNPAVKGGYYGYVIGGSYFGMDNSGDSVIQKSERIALTQNDGITLGTVQAAAGGTHSGAPNGSETEGIDKAWGYFGNTGLHLTSSATNILSATGNTATVDFSGWVVTWNAIPAIPMSGGAWSAGFTSGEAKVLCAVDCGEGDTFTLDYSATVPLGDESGFGGVQYFLHLVGTISDPANTPPTAGGVSISDVAGSSFNWIPDVNDNAPSTISCTIVGDGSTNIAGASATVAADCSTGTYTPSSAGFTGSDTFDYAVTDGINTPETIATVDVVISLDPAPICNNIGNVTANSGETTTGIALNVASNCTVSFGTPAIPTTVAVSATSAQGGAVTVDTGTQIATYTPAFGFSGVDTFTYTVSDSASASSPATVTVTVSAKSGEPTSPTGTVTCGTTAASAGATTDCAITTTDIGVADNGSTAKQGIAQSCIGGCFDFQVSGVTGDAQVVLTLSTAIPTPAAGNSTVYRKLTSAGWVNFVNSGTNAISSVPGTVSGADIICPAADDSAYASAPGLTVGNRCVRLTITDGGPNDDDGLVNGTVVDPGGVGESFFIDTRTSGTDGCSMTGTAHNANDHADWWLLSAFIGVLGWFSLKRKQA